MPTEELTLDEKRKAQLDENLRAMSEGGADNDAIVAYANDFKNKFGSPKSNAPSSQGGGSGAPTPPTTSTSASGASSLGSWTTEANPLKPKEQPIQVPVAKGNPVPIQEAPSDIKLFENGKTIRQEPKKTKLGTVAFDINEVKRNVAENPIAEIPLSQDEAFNAVKNLEKRTLAVDNLAKGQVKLFDAKKAKLGEIETTLTDIKAQIEKAKADGNIEAANQLIESAQPLIQQYDTELRDLRKQATKLEYLDSRKKNLESDMAGISEGQQYVTNQWSALNSGLSSLTAGILRAPSFVYNSMIALQNKIAKETGIPIAASPQTDGYLQQAAQYFQDNADAYNKVIEKKKEQVDYNIQDLLEKGDYNKAFNLLSESIMESAPTTAAIALSGMAGAGELATTLGGAAVFGNQTFEENKKKGVDENANYINSWVNGTLEGLFEATGTLQIVKHGAQLFKKEGAKAAEETAKNIWEKVYGKVAKKMFPVTSAVVEGVSEAETAFTQNYVNMVSGVDTEYQTKYNEISNSDLSDADKQEALSALSKQHLFQGVPDAFYVGAAMGGGMGLMQAKSGYTAVDNKKKEEIRKSQETLDNLNKTLTNPLVSTEAKEIIQAKADAEAEKIAALVDEDNKQLMDSLTKDEYNAVTDIQAKIETLEKSLGTIEDKESKSLVEQQIKELEAEKESILAQKPILKKNTSPTDEKYGTVNRNDGKGIVDLTKEEFLREQGIPETTTETPTVEVEGVSGSALKDVEVRKKEMKSENDKLQKRKFQLATERDDVLTSAGKYKNFGKKERDAKLEEIRSEVKDIDAKQVALQKELKVIEAKETGSVELFDHYSTEHGSTNTIIYDIKNDKLIERENVVRGKTKDISVEDAAKQKFAKSLRGRNQREINEAYTEEEKAKYESEIKDEIAKYKEAPTQYTEAATPKDDSAIQSQDFGAEAKQDAKIESAVIEIGGKIYEGKNHAEAILKAKADGQDISQVDRQGQGKFRLSDGTIIDRAEAKKRFGKDRSELIIPQDEAANEANKEYRKITEQSDVNIQQPMGESKADVGAVGEVAKENTQEQETTEQGNKKEVANEKENTKSTADNGQVNQPSQVKGEVNEVGGKNEVKGNVNPKFKAAKKVQGEATTIEMPNGETREAEYMVVESDDILASHNETSFSDTEGYPTTADGRNANSRNYKGDKSAQLKVNNDAKNLKPSIVISDAATPDTGVPIISEDGIVVSGNGRTMAIKLSQNIAPEKYDAYKADLLKRAAKFGLDPNEVAKMKKPILVKVDRSVKDYSVKTFDEYNGKFQKEESPIDKAIKRSSIIQNNEKLKERILSIIGRHETMTDLFENKSDRKELFDLLVANDIILSQETPKYLQPNGEYTADGKDLVNDILIATILSPETLEATSNVKAFRNKIINSLPVLSANYKLGENSLETEINDAIVLQSKIATMGSQEEFWTHLRQMGMFDIVNPNTVIINRLINGGANNFKKFVMGYNKSMEVDENNLFGSDVVLTKQQIIDNLKQSNLTENEKQVIANLEELYNANEQKRPIGNVEVVGGNQAKEKQQQEVAKGEKTAKQLAKESNAEKAKKISNKLRAIANKIGNGGINIKLDAGLTQWVTKQVLNRAADIIDATGNIIDGINYIAKEIEKGAKKAKIAYDKKQIKNAVKDFLGEEPTKEQISEYNQRVRDKKNRARAKKASPFTNYDGTSTGVQNMVAELERIQQGKEPIQISKEDKRDWKQIMKNANDWFLDADNNIETLVQKLKDGTPPTAEDVAVMTMYKVQLDGQLATALEQKENFFKNGKGDIVAIDRNISKISEDLDNYYEAARRSAYEQGLSFNMRKLMLNNDYSLAQTLRRAKAAGGNELIPNDVKKKLEDLTSQVAKHAEEINKLQEQAEKEKAQAVLDAIKATQDSKAKSKSNDNPKANAIKEKADKAVAALEKFQAKIRANRYSDATLIVAAVDTAITVIKTAIKAGGNISAAIQKGIDSINEAIGKGNWDENRFRADMEEGFNSEGVEVEGQKGTIKLDEKGKLKVSQGYLENLVKNGYDTIDKMVEFIQGTEEGKDLTERQIRDGITQYGETTHPPSDKIKEAVSIAKGEGRLLSALEDVTGGKRAQHSGFQRRPPTDRERRLAQEIYDKNKLIPQDAAESQKGWATALDRAKKALKNRIADLSNAIDTETKIQREKKVLELDKEGIKLKHKKNFKQAIYDELFKEGVTDEQRIEATKKSILDYKKKLESGDLSTKAKEQRKTENAELDALWKELDDLKKELQRRKSEARPKKSESDILKDKLFAEISKYSEAILNNERVQRNDKNRGALDAELQNLENAKEIVKEMYKSHFESEITAENDLKKIDATQKAIDNLADKLANNDLSTKAVIGTTNPKLQSLRDSLKDLNKQLAKARAAANTKTPLEALKISLQRDINNLNDALNGNAQLKAAPQNIPLDAQAQAMIDEKEQLKGLLDGLKQPKSDKQKMEELTDYYEKQAAQLDKDLNSLNIAYKIKQQFNETPELKAAKKKFADLKKVRDMMRELTGIAYANDVSIREKRNESTIKKLEQKLKDLQNGVYKPIVRKEQATSAKIVQQQKDMAYKKYLIEKEINKQEWAARPKWKKSLDAITGYYRAGVLSGIATVEKLMGYGIMESHIVTPLKNMTIGQIIRYIPYLKDVNEKAGVERVGSLKSEIAAQAKIMTEFYSKETWKDTWNVVKTGKSKLDLLHGDLKDMPPEVLAVIQHTHKALKNPTVRALFQSHLEKTLYAMQQAGQDTSKPEVMEAASKAALIEAYNSILLGKNELSKQWNSLIRGLELAGKDKNEGVYMATSTAAAILRILEPVSTVPVNFMNKAISYHPAIGLSKAAITSISRGVKGGEMTQQEAASMIRNIKSAGIGAAIYAVGYLLPQLFGGVDDDDDEKETGLKKGKIKGISKALTHHPIFELAHVAASHRRLNDKSNSDFISGNSAWNAFSKEKEQVGELMENTPFFSASVSLVEMFKDDRSMKYLAGNTAKNLIVPMMVQNIAKYMDEDEGGNVNRRKTDNLFEYIQSGIPVYRNKLINKDSEAGKKGLTIEDIENPDVINFNNKVKADGFTENQVEEMTAEYAKGIKDYNKLIEKGLVKENLFQKKALAEDILKEYLKEGEATKEEKLIDKLSKAASPEQKAMILKNEFYYKPKGKEAKVVEPLQTQENKIKRLLKKGVIDKKDEEMFYRIMSDINMAAKIKK